MCPLCLTTAAVAVAGATAAGGLTAFTVKVLHKQARSARVRPKDRTTEARSTRLDASPLRLRRASLMTNDACRPLSGEKRDDHRGERPAAGPPHPRGRCPGADGLDTGNDLKGAPCT